MASAEIELDVRGLPPCEPMERILACIETLGPGQCLRTLISREPLPLLPLLADRGFAWRVASSQPERCELLIWRNDDASATPPG